MWAIKMTSSILPSSFFPSHPLSSFLSLFLSLYSSFFPPCSLSLLFSFFPYLPLPFFLFLSFSSSFLPPISFPPSLLPALLKVSFTKTLIILCRNIWTHIYKLVMMPLGYSYVCTSFIDTEFSWTNELSQPWTSKITFSILFRFWKCFFENVSLSWNIF